jgi:hypothetical protein
MLARCVVTSVLVGITSYATFVLFEILRFRVGLNQPRVINDTVMHRILFEQIPKAPVSIAVGIACALIMFGVLCLANVYYASRGIRFM